MSQAELKVVSNATCTFCGCVCDDMELTVENDHITKAKNACVLGKAWFLNHHVEERPVALIGGKPASLDDAVERAAQILAGARYPIVYGLSAGGAGGATCPLAGSKSGAAVVFLGGTTPAESHPRHGTRYSTMPKGLF